ncbi:MAG: hypothetical protein M3Y43_06105, partial [Pseudomonadota bacterium]|nr:hypothetical protein [Pseudomonadota bacterium]
HSSVRLRRDSDFNILAGRSVGQVLEIASEGIGLHGADPLLPRFCPIHCPQPLQDSIERLDG